jgi:endonuclease/exonuclease/phosphatase (EEP) superfamily protein YafD
MGADASVADATRRRRVPVPPAPPRRWRIALTVIAGLGVIAALTGVVAHYRPPHRPVLLGVSAFAPYLMLAAPVALVLLLVCRRWIVAIAPAVLTALWLWTQVPLYISADPPAHAGDVVTMTSNLRLGEADPNAVVTAAREHRADLLMLEELTPDEQQRLVAAGLDRLLPYHVSDPRGAAEGTGLWSRYPLHDTEARHDFTFAFITARVAVPGFAREPFVAALHMAGPWPHSGNWGQDITHLRRVLPTLGPGDAVIAAGDFNATPDITQFRDLLTGGYRDGAEQAGAGITETYPADRWYPPLIAIDHVLTRDAVGRSAETVHIPGSDHRALVVSVAVARAA